MSPPLRLTGLSALAGGQPLLDDLDLAVPPGSVTAVLGASGSGKTTLGLAALGESEPGIVLHGSVRLCGTELLGLARPERKRLRSGLVAHLPQHPATVLDPVRRCASVLHEVAGSANRGAAARKAAVANALETAGLEAGEYRRRFPGELSGGQRQRMALATALVVRPQLLVLDEPTTGLDTVARAALLARLQTLRAAGTAMLLLTHDLPTVRAVADTAVVLETGRAVETGAVPQLLTGATHPATRALVREHPAPQRPAVTGGQPVTAQLLHVRGVLRDVTVTLPSGTATALVGASGAGKTTLARALAGLADARGTLHLGPQRLPTTAGKRTREQRAAIQYVHQETAITFAQRRAVLEQIAATAVWLRGVGLEDARDEATALTAELGLHRAALDRVPSTLSGGQLARCALARALLARPRLLICDEITAALDGPNTATLLRVLVERAARTGTTLLLAGHDLATLLPFADRVLVLEQGRCVEQAPVDRFRAAPASAAGRQLLTALHSLGAATSAPAPDTGTNRH